MAVAAADDNDPLEFTAAVAGAYALPASVATHPLSSVPALHSDPGAPATLFLDFTGEPAQHWYAYDVPATPAYDADGDPSTFSDAELANISQIWARVAEIYSPFNIDVTTVDPGNLTHGKTQRVTIGGDGAWSGGGLGGISVTGGFANVNYPNSSWVFPAALGGGDPHYVALAAAHEAGHSFGLVHQGVYQDNPNGTTTLVNQYNPGDALRAPIMGLPYGGARSLWWYGRSANWPGPIQDDLAVISNATNGFGYRPQDHGQDLAHADLLTLSDNGNGTASFTASGIIGSTADSDTFKFVATAAGQATFTLAVAPYGPTLHGRLQLLDASGNVIADADDANTLGQSITFSLPAAGTYYLVARSFGQYGDLGQYILSGTVPSQLLPAQVLGRYVFYNDSSFDGNDPAANVADDAAIDQSKIALLPGQTPTGANTTAYLRGINGIMIDVSGLANPAQLSVADLLLTSGGADGANPSTWSAAPSPTAVWVRPGAGVNGSDRIEITWQDGVIANEWLGVTLKATPDTGLGAPDAFYFGNLIGDANGNGTVTVADIAMTKGSSGKAAPVMSPTDFNGSGQITVADIAIAKASMGHTLAAWTAPSGITPAPMPATAAPADLSIIDESAQEPLSSIEAPATLPNRDSDRAPIFASRPAVHNEREPQRRRLRRRGRALLLSQGAEGQVGAGWGSALFRRSGETFHHRATRESKTLGESGAG